MFMELKTIWKEPPGENVRLANALPGSSDSKDGETHWEHRRRRVGVLFSKHEDIWNFIVLIGPGDNMMGFQIVDVDEKSEYPNTHLSKGAKAKCTHRPLQLKNIINYIDVRLKKNGPQFVESLARAIIWGWGEFLKEMRHEIIQVIQRFL